MAILQKKTARVGIRLEVDQDTKARFDRVVEQAAQAGYEIDVCAVASAALDRAMKRVAAELQKLTGKSGNEDAKTATPVNGAAEAGLACPVRSTRS